MIKKRVNAKENNFEVVLPPDGKIEKLAETLNKFPPLDFRKLIDEARAEGGAVSLDDAFKELVRRKTKQQLVEVLATLGLDESDPQRFVKGFALLSMVALGVGIVGFSPAKRKIERWTQRHDVLLTSLIKHYRGHGLKESQALRTIASDPIFENWFPYERHTGKEPKLSVKKRREESLRQRWQRLKRRPPSPNTPAAPLSEAIGITGDLSIYEFRLTALDIMAASKNRKKAT